MSKTEYFLSGYKFIVLCNGIFCQDIPSKFIKRFGNKIPEVLIYVLGNGEVIPGSYSKADKKLYGLLALFKKKLVNLFNILMFTYCGNGRFELCIFDKNRIEKTLEAREADIDDNVIIIGKQFFCYTP